MDKAIICYHSNEMSNSQASSTISKLEVNPINGLTVERKNIDKINFIKHLRKLKEKNELPIAVYVYHYNGRSNAKNNLLIENIEKEFPEINIEIYNNELVYVPARVPGNKLKTRVYILEERMRSDYINKYAKLDVYKVKTNKLYKKFNNEEDNESMIEKTKINPFDIFHSKGKAIHCYLTKDEALNAISETLETYENSYLSKVEEAKERLRLAEANLAKIKNDTIRIMNQAKEQIK